MTFFLGVAAASAGCSAASIGPEAELEAEARAFTVRDGTPEACAMLRVAREASFEVLDDEARLDRRAAENIIGAREEGWIGDLATLQSIPHVKKQALIRLDRYAREHSDFACGVVEVQILATNDFHGNLKPPSGSSGRIITGPDPAVNRVDAGGAEFLATHIKTRTASNANTVVVAAGDIIGASPLISALFHDEPTIESMNLLGLSIASVGNHEFDEGPDELQRMQYGGCHPIDGCQDGDDFEGARFQYLAANVRWEGTDETVFAPYEIRSFRGARVAFIGMTLEGTPLVVTPSGVAGLSFADEVETVNALVPELKAQGVSAIVVLLHEGGFATGLYNACAGISGPVFDIARGFDPEVDVVVAGHTNAAHICDIDGKLVTSAASFGRLVTDIDLSIDELTGQVVAKRGENVIVTRTVNKDADQTQLIAKYDALAAPKANRVIASISVDLTRAANAAGESILGDVIADAQLAATRAPEKGAAVMAFMNPGGIRADLLSTQLSGGEQPGEITYAEAFTVQPFGNTLMVMTLTGAQIDAILEQQWSLLPNGQERQMILTISEGLTYSWDATQPIGSRVHNLALHGTALDPAASYRVATNNFVADGGDGFSVFRQGTERLGGDVDLDALEAYLRAQTSFTAPTLTRITRITP
ncbi:MAG: bifunctional metallophosphatase/5'-nucleotidase [Deltaproteobacteria bacterium]|nr:bifunctional metallophosphatase/5'-nucleotidase [Deltaproteobacteria bacterium]